MERVLADLKPEKVFYYFEEISKSVQEKPEAARACVDLIDYADNMPVLMTAADMVVRLYHDRELYAAIQKGCEESMRRFSTENVMGEFAKRLS